METYSSGYNFLIRKTLNFSCKYYKLIDILLIKTSKTLNKESNYII